MSSNQFEREELQAPLSEINMTPLVDVMLVLLVIFLVTAPVLNSAITLNLPKEKTIQIIEKQPFSISINKDGQYFLKGKAVSESVLEKELQKIATENPQQQIHLRADTNVVYGKVSHVLAIAQSLGLNNIGFVTDPIN